MAEMVVKVTIPDDDNRLNHYGAASWVDDVIDGIEGQDTSYVAEVLAAPTEPAGHACPVCGGATPHGACGPGQPPTGVPYMNCCDGA